MDDVKPNIYSNGLVLVLVHHSNIITCDKRMSDVWKQTEIINIILLTKLKRLWKNI